MARTARSAIARGSGEQVRHRDGDRPPARAACAVGLAMRFPILSLVGTLLVALAFARMAALVLHDPLLGFANQYDMVRTGACVGLYPDLPPGKRDAATPDAPLEQYRLGARHADACYWGSEALLAGAVVAGHRLFGAAGAPFPALREL